MKKGQRRNTSPTSFLPWVSLPQRWPVFYKPSMKTMPNAESGPSARRFSLISPSVSLFTVGFWWFSFFLIITLFSQSGSGPVLVTSLPATPRPSSGCTLSQARRSVQALRSSKRKCAFVSSELLCWRALALTLQMCKYLQSHGRWRGTAEDNGRKKVNPRGNLDFKPSILNSSIFSLKLCRS